MKRIFSIVLCVLMIAGLFTACGKKKTDSSSSQAQSPAESSSAAAQDSSAAESAAPQAGDLNMKDVVAAVEQVAPISNGQELSPSIEGSDDYMTDLYGLDLSTIDDYYGKMSMVNVKSDVILMVKAKAGQTDAVKTALEARRDAIAASFEMYLTSEYDKAKNGRIVVKGDYVLLVIAGDSDRINNGEVDAVYSEIDAAIDAALK